MKIHKLDYLIVVNDQVFEGNEIGPDIKNGQGYSAGDVFTCGCGEQHVNIGLESKLNYVTCHKCREKLPDGDTIHWCHSSRFRKDATVVK